MNQLKLNKNETTSYTLCPDCEEHYLTTNKMQLNGICLSCQRRKTISKSLNRPYIKFKDLPTKERAKIIAQREKINKPKEKVTAKVESTKVKSSKNRTLIYTSEMIEHIKEIANNNITKYDLLRLVQKLYPDKKITSTNFQNILARHNIPYLKKERKRTKNINPIIRTTIINYDELEKTEVESYINENENENENVLVENNNIIEESTIENPEEKALKEINDVLTRKYRIMQCSKIFEYSIDDVLNAINMLKDIKENIDIYYEHGKKQHGILDYYEEDVFHEVENAYNSSLADYMLTKFKKIRNIRRNNEFSGKILDTLKSFVLGLDMNQLNGIIEDLEKHKKEQTNPVYIPRVDMTMCDKYDWAIQPSLKSNKTKNSKLVMAEVNKKQKLFRATALISGNGSLFKQWTYDYICNTEDEARSMCKEFWDKKKQEQKGLLITNLIFTQINR